MGKIIRACWGISFGDKKDAFLDKFIQTQKVVDTF